MATSQQPTPQGQQYVIDFTQSINLDNVGEKVYPFDDGVAPHLTNTGILRDDGVTNLYETTDTGSTSIFYTTSGSKVTVGSGLVKIDGTTVGTANTAVISRETRDVIDFAISTTGTGIQLRTERTGQYYELILEEISLSTGVVTSSVVMNTAGFNQQGCIIKTNSMTFATTRVVSIGMNGSGNVTCRISDSAGGSFATPYSGPGDMVTFQGISAISNGGRIIISGIPDNTVAPRTYYNTVSGAYGAWTAITDCAFIANTSVFETASTGTINIIGTPSNKSTANIASFFQTISITVAGAITITPSTVAGLVIVPSDLYSGFGFCSGRYKSVAATKFSPFYVHFPAGVATLERNDYTITDYAVIPQSPFYVGSSDTNSNGVVLNGILSQVGLGYSPICEFGYVSARTAVSIYALSHPSPITSYIFVPGEIDCQLSKISSDTELWTLHEISKSVFTFADNVGLIYDADKMYSEMNRALFSQTIISDGFLTGTNSVAWQGQGIYTNSPDVGQINNVVGITPTTTVFFPLSSTTEMTFYSGTGSLFSVFKADATGTFSVPVNAYVPNQNLPAPADASYSGGGVTLKSGAALQTVNFSSAYGFAQYYAGYTLANQYPVSYQFFNLFGQLYGFDGTKVYRMPVNGATAGTPEQVAVASGLTFITNAPTVAWFWSSFDNSVYTFDGGQNVRKWQEMPGVATVVSGAYSVLESSLYLQLSNDTTLVFRDDKASQLANAYTSQTIYTTDTGTYFVNADTGSQSKKWSYFAGTGTPITLTWQSGFYGWGRNQWGRITQVVFTLKVADSATTDITVNFKWLTSTDNGTETMTFTGGSYSASSTGYVRLQYNPTNPLVYGASVGISCTKKVTLYECVVYYTDGGVAQVPNLGP